MGFIASSSLSCLFYHSHTFEMISGTSNRAPYLWAGISSHQEHEWSTKGAPAACLPACLPCLLSCRAWCARFWLHDSMPLKVVLRSLQIHLCVQQFPACCSSSTALPKPECALAGFPLLAAAPPQPFSSM